MNEGKMNGRWEGVKEGRRKDFTSDSNLGKIDYQTLG